jgi:hypothetical protein
MSYNLKITAYNNRDYEQEFILNNSVGAPLNLTGYTLAFGIGTELKTVGTYLSSNASNKCIEITNAATGAFTLTLPVSVLRTLSPGTYIHDLILINPAGTREGIWSGQMIIKRGIA